jgi:hypothetical protein
VLRDVVATAAAAAAAVARDLPVEQVETTGSPVGVLQDESTRAELVVLGDRGLGGFAGLLIGSVAVALAARAACPVVVVRGPEPDRVVPRSEPVVVGVVGSPTSEGAVRLLNRRSPASVCTRWLVASTAVRPREGMDRRSAAMASGGDL